MVILDIFMGGLINMPAQQLMWKNGTHTIKETRVKDQFCFFRNDRQVLGNVGMIDIWRLLDQEAQDYLDKGEDRKKICLKGITSDGKGIIFTLFDQSTVARRPKCLNKWGKLMEDYFG